MFLSVELREELVQLQEVRPELVEVLLGEVVLRSQASLTFAAKSCEEFLRLVHEGLEELELGVDAAVREAAAPPGSRKAGACNRGGRFRKAVEELLCLPPLRLGVASANAQGLQARPQLGHVVAALLVPAASEPLLHVRPLALLHGLAHALREGLELAEAVAVGVLGLAGGFGHETQRQGTLLLRRPEADVAEGRPHPPLVQQAGVVGVVAVEGRQQGLVLAPPLPVVHQLPGAVEHGGPRARGRGLLPGPGLPGLALGRGGPLHGAPAELVQLEEAAGLVPLQPQQGHEVGALPRQLPTRGLHCAGLQLQVVAP
mmetsp:Transcript_83923/g.260985  ORF Transcript_83923/g.260985 Transcript_83923/m.260985 type:complete len:315 (-) Transcript_83923:1153-2097(-)